MVSQIGEGQYRNRFGNCNDEVNWGIWASSPLGQTLGLGMCCLDACLLSWHLGIAKYRIWAIDEQG